MEEFTAETERKGRDCASLLIDWMQPCHRAIGSHVVNCEFILGELFYTQGEIIYFVLRARPGFSQYFFWQAEAMRR